MFNELGLSVLSNSIIMDIVTLFAFSIVLIFVRPAAHPAIFSVSRVIEYGPRLGATSLAHAQVQLLLRNREVPLGAGREAAKRMILDEIHSAKSIR